MLSVVATIACMMCVSTALGAPSKKDVQKADRLFREARAAMARDDYASACPKLEESQKLDPAPGTQYQLAVCYESTDRPATALALYLEVADLAATSGHKDKEKVARANAAALEPKVPRMVVEVPAASRVSGLAVTRDGVPVEESQFGRPILVDPGDFTIEATAPGKKPFKSVVSVKGAGAEVTVPVVLEDERQAAPGPPPPSNFTFGPQRIAAVGVAALGVGGVVAGTVFGLSAKDAYEKAMSDEGLCPTKTTCYPEGKRLVDGAQTDALVSTITFIAGGVAIAGGVTLWLLAPSGAAPSPPSKKSGAPSSFTLVPVAASGYGGLAATGTF